MDLAAAATKHYGNMMGRCLDSMQYVKLRPEKKNNT